MNLLAYCKRPLSVLALLSSLCAGWLLGYGATAWRPLLLKSVIVSVPFGASLANEPVYPDEPLSWRNEPRTRSDDSETPKSKSDVTDGSIPHLFNP